MLDGFSMPGSVMLDANSSPNPFPVELYSFLSTKMSASVEPGHVSQDDTVYPAITYQLITSDSAYQLSGSSGIKTDTYQFDAWSPQFLDCAVAADELMTAMQGFRGFFGATEILTCNLHDQFSRWEKPIDASDVGVHRVMSQYLISYRTPVYNSN